MKKTTLICLGIIIILVVWIVGNCAEDKRRNKQNANISTTVYEIELCRQITNPHDRITCIQNATKGR